MAISGDGWEIIPVRGAVGPIGGLNARDQRSSAWQQGIKGERLSATAKKQIRVKAPVSITGGLVNGADGTLEKQSGNRRPARKRATGLTLPAMMLRSGMTF